MKKLILLIVVLVTNSSLSFAQINLIGAAINQATGKIDMVKWQALDPQTVETYTTELDGYLLASSAFNAFTSKYYLNGIIGQSNTLLSFDSQTNTLAYSDFGGFANISEIDMSSGKIYTLNATPEGIIEIQEHDVYTGTDTLIGSIFEPGLMGLVVDAIGFNSNAGLLYYIGPDGNFNQCLFSMDVRNSPFSYTKTLLTQPTVYGNITSVQYDNVSNELFAKNATFDDLGNYTGNFIVEVNIENGQISNRGELTGFEAFLASSSSYDQNTGSMLIVGFDSTFTDYMIVFNTKTNSFITGFVPAVSEIVCDNSLFAQSTYITSNSSNDLSHEFSLYPNPASNRVKVELQKQMSGTTTLSLIDSNGKLVFEEKLNNLQQPYYFTLNHLPSGFYSVKIQSATGIAYNKLLVR